MVLNSSHMASKKAFNLVGRLIWTWATKGRGMVRRKYFGVGRDAIVMDLVVADTLRGRSSLEYGYDCNFGLEMIWKVVTQGRQENILAKECGIARVKRVVRLSESGVSRRAPALEV